MNDKLILRINELYHDFGGDDYGSSHDEIFILEEPRWKHFAKIFFGQLPKSGKGKIILDIGSGTGFVPTIIGGYLNANDQLICSDISEKILQQCRSVLGRLNFRCGIAYAKYDGIRLPVKDDSIDVVTVNSVLHHIPNTSLFLSEANRVLKSGGYLIIGHESNADFFTNKIVWSLYRVLYFFYHPRSILDTLNRRGICRFHQTKKESGSDALSDKINSMLFAEELIAEPLTRSQINALVDFHSIEGFRIAELSKLLPNFKLIHLETYNHLWWVFMQHYKNPLIRLLDGFLGKLFPKSGKTMMLIYRKK